MDKDTKQDIAEDKSKGDKSSEETAGEDLKLGELDYAGIDEDMLKEDGTEKKSDIGGIMETSSIRDSIDRNSISINESKEKASTRKDGEVPKLTSGIRVIGDPTAKRLAIPLNSSGREGQYKDFSGLNLNLNQEISGSGEDISDFIGLEGTSGDDAPDYEGIDKVAQETDENSEVEGEDGSEGRERSHEV